MASPSIDLEALVGSGGTGVFLFAVGTPMEAKEGPLEPGGMSWEPDAPVVAGVSERRLELEMEGIPLGGSAIEGLVHMNASAVDQGPSHEDAVARLMHAIHDEGMTMELADSMDDEVGMDS